MKLPESQYNSIRSYLCNLIGHPKPQCGAFAIKSLAKRGRFLGPLVNLPLQLKGYVYIISYGYLLTKHPVSLTECCKPAQRGGSSFMAIAPWLDNVSQSYSKATVLLLLTRTKKLTVCGSECERAGKSRQQQREPMSFAWACIPSRGFLRLLWTEC